MIRHQEPELEDYPAWQKSWNEDERLLASTPSGYWFDLANIARVKRLLQLDMDPDLRVRFLETLNNQVRGILTLEAMQRVEPACDTAMKMLGEMEALSIDDRCRLMRRWNVMVTFINLNRSLLEAMKLFDRHPQQRN
jgi:hypothetical protein